MFEDLKTVVLKDLKDQESSSLSSMNLELRASNLDFDSGKVTSFELEVGQSGVRNQKFWRDLDDDKASLFPDYSFYWLFAHLSLTVSQSGKQK